MIPINKSFYLTFHGIGQPLHKISDEEKIVWVDEKTFSQFCRFAAENNKIKITFDDGNISDYKIAYPILQKHGLSGIFFILLGNIGKKEYLQKNHIMELSSNNMKIGLHGRNHVNWSKLNKNDLVDEIITAKKELENMIGKPVEEAACPYGQYNRNVLTVLKQADYKHVYTSDRGISSELNWLISRNSVRFNDNIEIYKHMIKAETKFFSMEKCIRFFKKIYKKIR